MKYTIPYSENISLPQLSEVLKLGVEIHDVSYDKVQLTGTVSVTGEYAVNQSEDVMVFTHEIPVTLIIENEEIDPSIEVTNVQYEVVPNKGIELIFELDVLLGMDYEAMPADVPVNDALEAEVTEFQNDVNEKLDEILGDREEESQDEPALAEVVRDEHEEVSEELEVEEYYEEVSPDVIPDEEDEVHVNVQAGESEHINPLATSYLSSLGENYSTYRICFLEDGETVEEYCATHDISPDSVIDHPTIKDNKIVIKVTK